MTPRSSFGVSCSGSMRVDDGRDAGEDDGDDDHDGTARRAPCRAGGDRAARRARRTRPSQRSSGLRDRRGSPSCSLRMREASIGQSVSATNVERTDGEGHHEAELGEEPAGGAGEERDRDEHRGERRRGGDARRRTPASRRAPRRRAGPCPCARWRSMFSSTTIASSTTRPVASTIASSVRMLMREAGEIDRRERADQRDRHGHAPG